MEWCELTILAGASSLSDVSNVITSNDRNYKRQSFMTVLAIHNFLATTLQIEHPSNLGSLIAVVYVECPRAGRSQCHWYAGHMGEGKHRQDKKFITSSSLNIPSISPKQKNSSPLLDASVASFVRDHVSVSHCFPQCRDVSCGIDKWRCCSDSGHRDRGHQSPAPGTPCISRVQATIVNTPSVW